MTKGIQKKYTVIVLIKGIKKLLRVPRTSAHLCYNGVHLTWNHCLLSSCSLFLSYTYVGLRVHVPPTGAFGIPKQVSSGALEHKNIRFASPLPFVLALNLAQQFFRCNSELLKAELVLIGVEKKIE